MATTNPRSKNFPFSRSANDDISQAFRREMEDVIKYLQSYIDEVVDNLDASSSNNENTVLTSTIDSLTTTIATLSSAVLFLTNRVGVLEANPFVIQTPFLLDLSFSGATTIPSNKAGFVPDGFNNNGTINVNGTLTVI